MPLSFACVDDGQDEDADKLHVCDVRTDRAQPGPFAQLLPSPLVLVPP